MKKSELKAMSFRLSPDARRLLAELASRQAISMTAVLELLLRKEAQDKDIDVDEV